jgi:hypothetical protein
VKNSTAPDPHPSTEEQDQAERPHVCNEGLVYIGHLVIGEDGEEVEVFDAVPCRRCAEEKLACR